MSILTAAATALKLRPVDEVAACRLAIAQSQGAVIKWRAEIAALPAKIDAAIVAEDNPTVDILEASATSLQRSIRKAELSLPALQRDLFEAEDRTKNRAIAKAQAQAQADFAQVEKALTALVKANLVADQNHQVVCEELGTNLAMVHVARVSYSAVSAANIEHFLNATEELVGRRARAPRHIAGIAVRIIAPTSDFQVGDETTLPDAIAHRAVKMRKAEYVDPMNVVAPTFAAEAKCPTPDSRGYVDVEVLRMIQGFQLLPREEAGAFVKGDRVSIPASQAIKWVRSGFAIFIDKSEAMS